MSRLYFSPISEAFILGSDQIKDTQAEIAKLKTIIGDSALVKKGSLNISKQETPDQRIGLSDNVVANFNPNSLQKNNDNMDLMKLVQHPKFDDIVKSYIIVNHPEWANNILNNTMYIPNSKNNQNGQNYQNGQNFSKSSFNNGFTKENFGNTYSTTVCSNVKNYLFFLCYL